MRLLIVGTLKGQLTTATKIAMDNGASVTHAEDHEQAMRVLRGGKGADLLLVDVGLDIRDLVMRLEAEQDRKSTRLNSSHVAISYAVFCLKKKKKKTKGWPTMNDNNCNYHQT